MLGWWRFRRTTQELYGRYVGEWVVVMGNGFAYEGRLQAVWPGFVLQPHSISIAPVGAIPARMEELDLPLTVPPNLVVGVRAASYAMHLRYQEAHNTLRASAPGHYQ